MSELIQEIVLTLPNDTNLIIKGDRHVIEQILKYIDGMRINYIEGAAIYDDFVLKI